jgi:hypothetical protein
MSFPDTRTLCGGLLLLCMASGCAGRGHCARRGLHQVGQCGQGHTSLLDCMLSKMDSPYGRGHCADGCEPRCAPYSSPVMPGPGMTQPNPAPPEMQTVPQFSPPPPPEPMTSAPLRLLRRGRRMLHRLPDSLELSIPLPTRWIGSTAPVESEPPVESQEPMGEIPWNAPVATAEPETTESAETAQIVGYEYGQPVELVAPRFEDADEERVAPASGDAGHSVLIRPLRR